MTTDTTTPRVINADGLALNDRADMDVQHVTVAGTPALVVDNLYRDPEYVRGLALSLAFRREAGAYPGFLAFISISANPLLELVDDVMHKALGHHLQFTPYYRDDFAFAVITKRGDELEPGQKVPHCDGFCGYAGIVYLNLPEQCSGGTSFWRHRRTGLELALGSDGAAQRLATNGAKPAPDPTHEPPTDEGTGYLIASNADWELTQVLEMRFNRLVFYSSNIFHSPFYDERDFGTTLDTRRLAQNLYFDKRAA
jgi:hypothetical protein